jgi:thermosome
MKTEYDGHPLMVLKEETERETGRSARANNIHAARVIADAVKSTLGPRGMDKMLVDSLGDVVVTNDGATILKELEAKHPAAKMIIEVAKSQDEACGDGTSTGVVLAGELLKQAEGLLEQDIHATIVAEGFRLAAQKAIEVLRGMAAPVKETERARLVGVATTALASKSAAAGSKRLAETAVDACLAVAQTRDGATVCDVDNVQIQKSSGGTIDQTRLVEGAILDKERVHPRMPESVEDAKVALVNVAFEVKKTEVDAKIEITNPNQLNQFLAEEERFIKNLVEKVTKSGANVLVCQKGIDDLAQHLLAKAGVYAVRRAKKSDMEKLAKATGATVVSTLDELDAAALGVAGSVCQERVGDKRFTFVTECKDPKAVSVLVRGGSEQVVEEYARAFHDALSVVAVALEDGKLLPGGGAHHVEAATRLREHAPTVGGREQLAIEAFADALEVIPRTLAENAGLDGIDVIIDLRRAHKKGQKKHGINVFTGKVEDMTKQGVVEPLRVGTQCIASATEAATMILRIDDVIRSKPSEGGPSEGASPGDLGGMPPGMGGIPPGMGGFPPM